MVKEGKIKKIISVDADDAVELSSNVVVSKPDEGLYQKIRQQKGIPDDFVYCSFPPCDKLHNGYFIREQMWVRIQKGNQKKGVGLVWNVPHYNTEYKLYDLVEYEFDEEDDKVYVIANLEKTGKVL
jgi:hypothetical protein